MCVFMWAFTGACVGAFWTCWVSSIGTLCLYVYIYLCIYLLNNIGNINASCKLNLDVSEASARIFPFFLISESPQSTLGRCQEGVGALPAHWHANVKVKWDFLVLRWFRYMEGCDTLCFGVPVTLIAIVRSDNSVFAFPFWLKHNQFVLEMCTVIQGSCFL